MSVGGVVSDEIIERIYSAARAPGPRQQHSAIVSGSVKPIRIQTKESAGMIAIVAGHAGDVKPRTIRCGNAEHRIAALKKGIVRGNEFGIRREVLLHNDRVRRLAGRWQI